jgi:plasmid maintenance system antidote protein VapI
MRRELHRAGRLDAYVDATPAREHIHQLFAARMTRSQIAALADVHRHTVTRIANGRQRSGYQSVVDALCAVPVTAAHPNGLARVDGTGSRRRLRGLVAQGHSPVSLARQLGVDNSQISHWLRDEKARFEARTAARIARLADQLEFNLGGSGQARARAAANRWPPLLAWDPDMIDNPAATPTIPTDADTGADPGVDAAVVWTVCAGDRAPRQLNLATRLEVIRVCAARGESDALIADRLRLGRRTVERLRVTHQIPTGHAITERRAVA